MVSGNVGEILLAGGVENFGSEYRDKKMSLGIIVYRGAEYSIFYMNGVT
jgi:hypothetical protein